MRNKVVLGIIGNKLAEGCVLISIENAYPAPTIFVRQLDSKDARTHPTHSRWTTATEGALVGGKGDGSVVQGEKFIRAGWQKEATPIIERSIVVRLAPLLTKLYILFEYSDYTTRYAIAESLYKVAEKRIT